MNTAKKLTGTAIALAAASLFLSNTVLAGDEAGMKKEEGKVHCAGLNSCKGKTACKSASNECKGKNSCKGKGWLPTATKEECQTKGGKVES